MTLLNRYIGRVVITTISLVLFIFMGLLLFINFVGQLGELGSGQYDVSRAFLYVLLMIPNETYQLFPMVGLLGSLIGLGLLANHHELMVMRSCGVSKFKIAQSVMKAAFLVMLVVTLIGETAGPYFQRIAEAEKAFAENNGQTLSTDQGVWLRQGDEFVNIQHVEGNDYLSGVLIYTFNEHHQLTSSLFAKDAVKQQDDWFLRQVGRSTFTEKGVVTDQVPVLLWHLSIKTHLFDLGFFDPAELNLLSLRNYIDFRKTNGLQSADYSLTFWRRVLSPVATLVMIFLSIPFVFGSLRHITMGVRVLFGIIMGLAFFLLNELLSQLSIVVQLPPLMAVGLPILIFALLGCLFVFYSK